MISLCGFTLIKSTHTYVATSIISMYIQGRTQNLMCVDSFQEKVDLFDGAGVQSMLKLGGLGACPPRKILKNRYQNTGFGDISVTKAPLNVGQKYVYSLHIIATPCI